METSGVSLKYLPVDLVKTKLIIFTNKLLNGIKKHFFSLYT